MLGGMTSSAKSVRSDIISAISRDDRVRSVVENGQGRGGPSAGKDSASGAGTPDRSVTDDGIGSLGESAASSTMLDASLVQTSGEADVVKRDTFASSASDTNLREPHKRLLRREHLDVASLPDTNLLEPQEASSQLLLPWEHSNVPSASENLREPQKASGQRHLRREHSDVVATSDTNLQEPQEASSQQLLRREHSDLPSTSNTNLRESQQASAERLLRREHSDVPSASDTNLREPQQASSQQLLRREHSEVASVSDTSPQEPQQESGQRLLRREHSDNNLREPHKQLLRREHSDNNLREPHKQLLRREHLDVASLPDTNPQKPQQASNQRLLRREHSDNNLREPHKQLLRREHSDVASLPDTNLQEPQQPFSEQLLRREHSDDPSASDNNIRGPQQASSQQLLRREHFEVSSVSDNNPQELQKASSQRLLRREHSDTNPREPQEAPNQRLLRREFSDVPSESDTNLREPQEASNQRLLRREHSDVPSTSDENLREPQQASSQRLLRREHSDVPSASDNNLREPQQASNQRHLRREHSDVVATSDTNLQEPQQASSQRLLRREHSGVTSATNPREPQQPSGRRRLRQEHSDVVVAESRPPGRAREGGPSLARRRNKKVGDGDNTSSFRRSQRTRLVRKDKSESVRREEDLRTRGADGEASQGDVAGPSPPRSPSRSLPSLHDSLPASPSVRSTEAADCGESLPTPEEKTRRRTTTTQTAAAAGDDGTTPGHDPRLADSHSRTSNIDIELDIFVEKSGEENSELQDVSVGGAAGDGARDEQPGKEAGFAGEAEEPQDPSAPRSAVGSLHIGPEAKHRDLEDHLTSVLRSREAGRKVRSSSVGHRVRFVGQCCIAEPACEAGSHEAQAAHHLYHSTSRRSRRLKRKLYRSASVSNMAAGVAKDEEGRQDYSTLLREIHALMAEVQRQREDFRSEMRSLASSITRKHTHVPKNCVCSGRRISRLPVMMSTDQEATKEVKEEVKEEEKEKDTTEKEDKEEKEEDGRTSAEANTPEPRSEENGDDTPGTPRALNLREQFRNFSKFGDTKSDGRMLTLSQADKWFKQARVIDGKTLTTTDTAITFNKFKTKKITFVEFEKYLDEIGKSKKLDPKEIKTKLKDCGAPGTSGTTSVVKSSAVNRLTDTKKFTGSHKLRFDSTGRGKGIAGRKDIPDSSGYVSGYRNKNTYDKTH